MTGLFEAQVGTMDEEDSPHDHSMESEQPTKRHSKESKKDEKKRKRSRHLDSGSEGGKSARHSPAIHLSSFEPSLREGARVSVHVTPVLRGVYFVMPLPHKIV